MAMEGFSGHGLGCIRGERLVFSGLDFTVAPGRALLLAGANGSGKSTLLRIMAGLLTPEAGTLAWDGADIAEDTDAHRRRLAYVGHADPVKPALSVTENLTFWSHLFGLDDNAEAALIQFGIDHLADLPARYLSAGQRRRLTLARLAVGQNSPAGPPLWLLDEPATGLDDAAVAMLANTILAHLANGGIAVIASHGGGLDDAIAGHADRFALAPFAGGDSEAA
jgi:heme exporter protein A